MLRTVQNISKREWDRKWLPGITVLLTVISITVFQDFIHSRYNSYPFFISESLLFKVFWVLFFPISVLQIGFLNKTLKQGQMKPSIGHLSLSVLFSSVIHVLLFPLIILCLSGIFLDHSYKFAQTFNYTVAEDIYKYLLVYSAVGGWQWFKIKVKSPAREILPEPQPAKPKKISIGTGRNNIAICTEDILFISSANPYITIYAHGKKYLHSETLKSVIEKLNHDHFIRIHKSTIVNLKKVASYKSRLNGDYDILLENGEELRLSRNYAAAFKQYFS